MKKLIFLVTLILNSSFLIFNCSAQAPSGFTYQSVLRDANNDLIINTTVGTQISILQTTSTGTAVYVETHSASTNANGLLTLEVGSGTVVSGTFGSIDWSAGPYFIKAETDPAGGTSYTITGTQQMMSVPYALYAATSGNATADDGDWTVDGNDIYPAVSGNVGIGTTTPDAELDVNGQLRISRLQSHGFTTGSNVIQVQATTDTDQWIRFRRGGNPRGETGVIFSEFDNDHFFLNNVEDALAFSRSTQNSATPDFANSNELMRLAANGNLGVGTSSPSEKLDVNGKIRMRTGASNGHIPVSSSNGTMTWTDPSNIVAGGVEELDVIDERNTDDPFLSGSSSTTGWRSFVYAGPNPGPGTYLVYVSFRAKVEGGSGNNDDVEFRLAAIGSGACSDISTTSTGVIENLDEPRNQYQVISFQRVITIPDNSCGYSIRVQGNLDGTDDDVRITDIHTTVLKIGQ